MNDSQTQDFYVALGKRLRDVRLQHGMTQEDVADALGAPYQVWQRYEYGDTKISLERLQAFATLFGLPVAQLMELPVDISTIPPQRQNRVIAQGIEKLPIPIGKTLFDLVQVINQELEEKQNTTRKL